MKVRRTLPPSAASIEFRDLVEGLLGLLRQQSTLEQLQAEFGQYFGVKHVWFVSSGKAALTLILQALRGLSGREKVVLPGYTCFSVPSAVVRAKLSVALCDVDPLSLDFDFAHLSKIADSSVLCVLATHLLGMGIDVPRVVELCRRQGIFVVEDVAQAFGGHCDAVPFGAMGDVSFLSFGRGKNITCGSGGAILTNNDCIGEALAREYASLSDISLVGMLKNWLEVAVTQVLIKPSLYWLPAGLPFLKLGETKFYTDFPVSRLDPIRAGLLRRWKRRLDKSTASRVAHSEQILRSLTVADVRTLKPFVRGQSVYLRFPVLMRSSQEKDAVCRLSAREGLGISSMYPSSLQHIPELRDALSSQEVPQSTSIAERLVTLPTHEFLSDSDLVRISDALQAAQRVAEAETRCPSDVANGQHPGSPFPRAN